MNASNRRGFLALSAVGVAAAAAGPVLAAGKSLEATNATSTTASTASGPVVAYIHDAARGEVSVMHGEREVVVHDPALVRLISKHV
jgi:hypothetical protein